MDSTQNSDFDNSPLNTNNSNTKTILITVIITAVLVGLLGYLLWGGDNSNLKDDTNSKNTISALLTPAIEHTGITITEPKLNEKITFPYKVTGYITGDGWSANEGETGSVQIFDANDKAISGMMVLIATTNWQELPTYFETTIGKMEVSIINTDTGYLLFRSTGAKDGDVTSELKIPVSFTQGAPLETPTDNEWQVNLPRPNQRISSPVSVTGLSDPFEGNTRIKVIDLNDVVLADTFTTGKGGNGIMGVFSKNVTYTKPTASTGVVEVFEDSAKDGSQINLIRIPVRFADFVSIDLTSPSKNDVLRKGNTYAVTWHDVNVHSVNMTLNKGSNPVTDPDTAAVYFIVQGHEGGSTFSWTVPGFLTEGGDYTIGITGSTETYTIGNGQFSFDLSDTFTIAK